MRTLQSRAYACLTQVALFIGLVLLFLCGLPYGLIQTVHPHGLEALKWVLGTAAHIGLYGLLGGFLLMMGTIYAQFVEQQGQRILVSQFHEELDSPEFLSWCENGRSS
jgi:hypothetical protein